MSDQNITPELLLAKIPAVIINQLTVALDADKTVTRIDRTVSPATKLAIQAIFDAGGRAGLCTGRAFAPATHVVLPVFPPQSVHVVAGGGALVTQLGKRLWGREIPGKIVAELVKKAQEFDCGFGFGIDEKFYVSSNRKEAIEKFLSPMKLYDFSEAPVLTGLLIPILVITELNSAMKAVLASYDQQISYKLMLDYKDEEYVDVTAVGVNKASGLKHLAEYYCLPMEHIITVGDGLNDLEMIEAGFGIAMGNSSPDLKQAARLVIGQTDDDGLAKFLMALIEAKKILAEK